MPRNRIGTYILIGFGGLVLAWGFGINPAFLLLLVMCPLMMFFMMGSMGGRGHGAHGSPEVEDHRAHGCEHDPTRQDPVEPGRDRPVR